jgi:FtsP/CotA-like multicopper oxidase with cupredoxin domain
LGDIVTLKLCNVAITNNTTLPKDAPVKELKFTLTGNMNRYVWSMDNKVLSEVDKIPIKKGENLRITIINNSMMRHPMHLHGHDFRVINGQGEKSPLKKCCWILCQWKPIPLNLSKCRRRLVFSLSYFIPYDERNEQSFYL